ncbi:hypothetical protein Y032_0035g3118 [Ancylostoma ceylanicum]|uniref:Uncharacterized protein n=1 Tax=Ancylostoma ceylanicum TaxID=53326 RepID=A0A016UMJ7_9BILA|nr:hypothetical protein Y032_0035g3118 [Ancylostoma ceylanicum]
MLSFFRQFRRKKYLQDLSLLDSIWSVRNKRTSHRLRATIYGIHYLPKRSPVRHLGLNAPSRLPRVNVGHMLRATGYSLSSQDMCGKQSRHTPLTSHSIVDSVAGSLHLVNVRHEVANEVMSRVVCCLIVGHV